MASAGVNDHSELQLIANMCAVTTSLQPGLSYMGLTACVIIRKGESPSSADAVLQFHIIWVDVKVVRGAGAARHDQFHHCQLTADVNVSALYQQY